MGRADRKGVGSSAKEQFSKTDSKTTAIKAAWIGEDFMAGISCFLRVSVVL